MSNESYIMVGALLLLGLWAFSELRLGRAARHRRRGRPLRVSIELDEDERAELMAVLCRGIAVSRAARAVSPGGGELDDWLRRRMLVERVIRRLDVPAE